MTDGRTWVYVGGIAVILAARLGPLPRLARTGLASLALGVMVLTYAAERWERSDGGIERPLSLGFGFVGVVGGVALSISGQLAGLAFLAGGLWFLSRAFGGGGVDGG